MTREEKLIKSKLGLLELGVESHITEPSTIPHTGLQY
jgi:hypothetical protein